MGIAPSTTGKIEDDAEAISKFDDEVRFIKKNISVPTHGHPFNYLLFNYYLLLVDANEHRCAV